MERQEDVTWHIVQFGINIDDTAIAEAVKRDAYKEVIK